MKSPLKSVIVFGLFATASYAQDGETLTAACNTAGLSDEVCACATPVAEEVAANSNLSEDDIGKIYASIDGSGDNAGTVAAAARELRGQVSRENMRDAASFYVQVAKECIQ